MFTRLVYSRKPWTNASSESIISSDNINWLHSHKALCVALLVISNSANKCIAQRSFLKQRQTNCYSRLPYCLRTLRRDLTRLTFDSHLIQSNAFESNASANADESNTNANASAAKESSASANANAAFALAFANASAFEHKPGLGGGVTVGAFS